MPNVWGQRGLPGIALTLGLLPGIATAAPDAADAPGNGAANAAATRELPEVLVIGTTPLPGFGLPLNQVATNVQTADSEDLKRSQANDVADYLNRSFTGVNASESANNPFQIDVLYHGFTASPLLGTPEGLSVYVDGVRVNESFGDTVNWDLIPESAVSTVSLISGSNPVFGLNTLGGALSIQTKSGHDNPGTQFEAYGGSFGRRSFEGESGGSLGAFDYFATVRYFEETGWRDTSPSRLWQAFGKVGWQTETTDLDLSYTYADTDLTGNGAVPQSMYAYRRETSYTPDVTQNLLHFVNLTGTQMLDEHWLLSGNAFYRRLATTASNGSNNDNYLADTYAGPPLDCGAQDSRAAIAYCSQAATQVSLVTQRSWGGGVQLTDSQDLGGWKNQAILGADYTAADDVFSQNFLYGAFAPDRTLEYFASPLNNETVIALSGSNRIFGTYFTDTLSPRPWLHVTLAARYNRNTEALDGYSIDTDVGDYGQGFDEASPVTGNHTFSRLNPSLGVTFTPTEALTYYANYNEASRAPTVIELGCANPQQPCGLPNDFASDPDLKQVVARTFEVGVRGQLAGERLNFSADVFRVTNRDDIQFIATTTNAGYFANVGTTRREGVDLGLGGKLGALTWRLAYSYVQATFESDFEVSAESNSTADANGNIQVRAGDRLPLVPLHTGRLLLDYALSPRLEIGGNLVAVSGSYLHGNENNANQAGGTNGEGAYIQGSGWIPGYVVVNLEGTWHASPHLDVFARVVNLFDRQYATGGFLTTNTFTPGGAFKTDPDTWTNENAISPGAPLGVWAGVRLRLN
ncbi:MAG: TonB-dependent receptor [Proteobacteria bacterium]|nr:TonB-dependent receptor [Pseudomonadota bacterium]